MPILQLHKSSETPHPRCRLFGVSPHGASDDRFAFDSTPGADARMAEAMLLPWVDRQPPDEVRTFIEGHLLSLLHDLRIERSRWVDVDEEAKRVMRRWLTRASLEQFLDVVDRTAQIPHVARSPQVLGRLLRARVHA